MLRASIAGAAALALVIGIARWSPHLSTIFLSGTPSQSAGDDGRHSVEAVALSLQALTVMAEAAAWLERDDEHSLERAAARFADAAELSPHAAEPLVFQSLAEGLLAASLVAELRDYEAEIERRHRGGEGASIPPPTDAEPLLVARIPSEELVARSSALRLRADVHLSRAWTVAMRAEVLETTGEKGATGRRLSVLPKALARIVSGDVEQAKELLGGVGGVGQDGRVDRVDRVGDAGRGNGDVGTLDMEPWEMLIRGLLSEASGEKPSGEAGKGGPGEWVDSLAAAAEAGLVRARVELVRRELGRVEQDSSLALHSGAGQWLAWVLEHNPEHEQALRLSALLAERLPARGVAEGH